MDTIILWFYVGEIIIGDGSELPDWFSGSIGPRHGIFPANHVWKIDLSILKVKKSI